MEVNKNIWGIYHVNINCSNLEKSREFYEQFGFRVMMDMRNRDREGNIRPATPPQQALYESLGLPRNSHCDGYMMAIPGRVDWCCIDLLEWHIDHPNYQPDPTPRHVACLGFQRVDIFTQNISEEIERLHQAGIDPVYPICDVDYMGARMHQCCYLDPDGTIVEFCEVDYEYEDRFKQRLWTEPAAHEEKMARKARERAEREAAKG